jgi:hypothetical protein
MPGQVQEIPPARAQSMKAWWVCTALFAIVFVAIRLACANYPLFWDEWGIFFALLSYWFVITFILASIYYFFIHKETAEVARID